MKQQFDLNPENTLLTHCVYTELEKYDSTQAWTGSTGQHCGQMEKYSSEVVDLRLSLLA